MDRAVEDLEKQREQEVRNIEYSIGWIRKTYGEGVI